MMSFLMLFLENFFQSTFSYSWGKLSVIAGETGVIEIENVKKVKTMELQELYIMTL